MMAGSVALNSAFAEAARRPAIRFTAFAERKS
jgi:hypothetical protein